jgi:hypothetical protein
MMCWPHRWVIKEVEILPSYLEQIGDRLTSMEGGDPSHKSVLVSYQCAKCGTEKVERL